jgi:Rrf2 family nitric oxide-sensitive transcriptional repressor
MRLTRFTDYSLRVLVHLGQNRTERVTIHQISETYDISKNHLMKVVSNLTRLQFVVAQRGPGGGIRLNRSPAEINLKEVIGNTEKHLQQLNGTGHPETNGTTADTRLSGYLQHALHAYLESLGRVTLADVLQADDILTPKLDGKTA